MNHLILHHFDASPFAEKVRLTMGIKGLCWHSVEIPMIMPKPDLMPLTGGYRKTPVLQTGAEIYCDTRLIMEVIERRHPLPALYGPGVTGLARSLTSWSDKTFFEPGAALSMALNDQIPDAVMDDRKAFFEFMNFDELDTCAPHMLSQFIVQVASLESQLSDGRDHLLGDSVTAVDVLGFFVLWMVRANVPGIDSRLARFTATAAWEARMSSFGHGQRQTMAAQEALDIAGRSDPGGGDGVDDDDASGLQKGDRVSVAPTDYGAVPVVGELITLNCDLITLRRQHARVGEVNTHFPRAGYEVQSN